MYTVNIPEDAPRGSTILAPVSSDRDASTNKELRFSITKGNDMVYQLSLYQFSIYLSDINTITLELVVTF